MKLIQSLCVLTTLLSTSFIRAEEVTIQYPQPEGPLMTQIPGELKSLMLENPYVELLVLLNEEGQIEAALPIYASYYALIPSARQALGRTTFQPAMKDGQAIPIRFKIHVLFEDLEQEIWKDTGIIPMGSNVMDGTQRRLSEAKMPEMIYTESEILELDAPLKLVSGSMVVMEDKNGVPCSGVADVEYYVDSEGTALLATILSSDNELVGLSAIESVKNLQFEPLTKNKLPTYIKIRQQFQFSGE